MVPSGAVHDALTSLLPRPINLTPSESRRVMTTSPASSGHACAPVLSGHPAMLHTRMLSGHSPTPLATVFCATGGPGWSLTMTEKGLPRMWTPFTLTAMLRSPPSDGLYDLRYVPSLLSRRRDSDSTIEGKNVIEKDCARPPSVRLLPYLSRDVMMKLISSPFKPPITPSPEAVVFEASGKPA